MLKKLFGLFKKESEDTKKQEEFLDFSDFTDVNISGTRTIRPSEMEDKGSNQINQMAQPAPLQTT